MANVNLYHKRLVAASSSKPCWICYRPSATVLITPESDDWFHICPGHLTDRNFATAKDAVDEERSKREQELEKEIEAVKREWEEKMKSKKKKKQQKDDKKDDKKDAKSTEDEEKEKDDKLKQLEDKKSAEGKDTDGPRIFELTRHFYQMRVQKKQQAAITKRNAEMLRNPTAFPAAPTGDP